MNLDMLLRLRQHRACMSLGTQQHLQQRLAGQLNLFISVSRHESIAGFATKVLRVNLLNGAAAAPRPSKAVNMNE